MGMRGPEVLEGFHPESQLVHLRSPYTESSLVLVRLVVAYREDLPSVESHGGWVNMAYREHGSSIRDKADFVISWPAQHPQLYKFAFQPPPVRLTPDDDIVKWVHPVRQSVHQIAGRFELTSPETHGDLVLRILPQAAIPR